VSRRPGWVLPVACALALTANGVMALRGARAAGSTAAPSATAPLAAAVTTATGSWAVVAMGDPHRSLDTFWELFFRATTQSSWRLVTPPGVADNGGLTLSVAASGIAAVGFEPSQQLRFSPLARSQDDGATWAPALVPGSLVSTPDALAISPAAPPTALALVRKGAGQVLIGGGALLNWRPLSGTRSLGSTTQCGVDGLDAVSLGPSSIPLLGTGCRRPGQVGVFAHSGAHWMLIGPSLHGALATSTTRVLRLDSSGATTTALVVEESRHRPGLLALWRSAAGTWVESPPLALGAASTVRASAVAPNGQQLVLVSRPGTTGVLEEARSPGQPWIALPTPPAGTVTVAPLADGSVNAFSVHGSRLKVFTVTASRGSWSLSQTINVPIAYGSS
jgi:hypothetical protein